MPASILRGTAAVAIAAAACIAVTPMVASAGPAAGTHYYLSCGSGNDSSAGTSTSTAWNTLAKASSVTFGPGDTLSLRDGTTCTGVLTPHGSGTASAPITINSYGSGNLPKIVGNNARATIYLHNVQGYELDNLDVSDLSTSSSNPNPQTGIYIENTDYGNGNHYVVNGVNVHNIAGCDCPNPGQPSGGVVFNADGANTLTSFSDIKVTNSTFSNVNGVGVLTTSLWQKRAQYPGGPGTAFGPITGVVVQNNTMSSMGGDGIDVSNGVNALVQNNTVAGFGLHASTSHAGIWTWNSDYSTIQYNNVSGGNSGQNGAFAFDVDGGNTGTLFQYNFSHDNTGFMLLCATQTLVSANQTVRDNISQNDGDLSGGVIILACSTQTNPAIYDNDFYEPNATTMVDNMSQNAVAFTNDVFVGAAGGTAITDTFGTYGNNNYDNITNVPSGDPHAVVGAPRFSSPGNASSRANATGYHLQTGSPDCNAGAVIANNGGIDFFGNAIPGSNVAIGADQGSC